MLEAVKPELNEAINLQLYEHDGKSNGSFISSRSMVQMLARRAEVATTSGIRCVLVGAPLVFDSLQYLTHEYQHLFWHQLK